MRKIFDIFICLVVIFSFSACTNQVKFTETDDETIVTIDGTEYTFVGYEGRVWCFGEWEFIGHVKGEKRPLFILPIRLKQECILLMVVKMCW